MKSLILGAPSLTGKDAKDLVNEAFSDVEFPMQAKVTNLVARSLNFPEVNGLHLSACTDDKDCQAKVCIASLDALHRLASSIEQVSELNNHKELVEIVVIDADYEAAANAEAETVLTKTDNELTEAANAEAEATKKNGRGNKS